MQAKSEIQTKCFNTLQICILFFRLMYSKFFSNAKCMIPALRTVHKLSKNNKTISDCKTLKFHSNQPWASMMEKTKGCLEPCEILEYHSNNYKSRNWKNATNKIAMLVFFNSYDVSVQEEYLIYGEVDLVGIVGGNLGLFIGFSFSGFINEIINSIANYFFFKS